MRKIILTIFLALLSVGANMTARAEAVDFTGSAFEDSNSNGFLDMGEKTLPDVAVSDGVTVVITDAGGQYRIGSDADRIIFVSVPGTHHAADNNFSRATNNFVAGERRIDFPLVRNADTTAGERFTFAFVTDTHVADYRRAKDGVARAYRTVAELNPALVVHGGDVVFDAMKAADEKLAENQYSLYKNSLAPIIKSPFYHTIGNHDVFGWTAMPEPNPVPPLYGKRMFNKYFGPSYYSFNYKHCHFIVLDSIGRTEGEDGEPTYHGFVDETQIEWLRKDLAAVDRERPIIIVTHIPMINALASLFGLKGEVVPLPGGGTTPKHQIHGFARLLGDALRGYNFKLALAGHYHTFEEVHWKSNECDAVFIVGGAICGGWWKGDHRVGLSSWPEGFTMVEVDGQKFTASYISYGWKGTEEQ